MTAAALLSGGDAGNVLTILLVALAVTIAGSLINRFFRR